VRTGGNFKESNQDVEESVIGKPVSTFTNKMSKYMNKGIKVNAPKSHQMALDHSSINYDSDNFLDEEVLEHPPKRDYNLLGSFEI